MSPDREAAGPGTGPSGLVIDDLPGELPLVRRVWSATCDRATGFTSAAKPTSMIVVTRAGGGVAVHLRGPETAGTSLTCPAGSEFFGVEFRLGASVVLHPPSGLTDLHDAVLPTVPGHRILLGDQDWEMPTEQNVDVFVERLARAGLLVLDPVVDEIRHGERPRGMSDRVAQARFRRAVGISHRTLVSIERARRAARLLTAGSPIADVVAAAGYYDQPQLARAMRWATGHTPAELRSGVPFLAW
ncbi:hypothetical protein GCM10009836_18820 [Pseudonocardia ailaonensis]|uniref:HTH araC/xylS-type domain-containing protein n=1 Tax=Pseudonocardia ailaonensis TaxID=367279 RepID=A0ABN2MVM6_9PSEU